MKVSNFKDCNWINGISIDGHILLIENATEEYYELIGRQLRINEMDYNVLDVILQLELYTHIVLDKSIRTSKKMFDELQIQILR